MMVTKPAWNDAVCIGATILQQLLSCNTLTIPHISRPPHPQTCLRHTAHRGLTGSDATSQWTKLAPLAAFSLAACAVWHSACAVSKRPSAPFGSFCASNSRACLSPAAALSSAPCAAATSAFLVLVVLYYAPLGGPHRRTPPSALYAPQPRWPVAPAPCARPYPDAPSPPWHRPFRTPPVPWSPAQSLPAACSAAPAFLASSNASWASARLLFAGARPPALTPASAATVIVRCERATHSSKGAKRLLTSTGG